MQKDVRRLEQSMKEKEKNEKEMKLGITTSYACEQCENCLSFSGYTWGDLSVVCELSHPCNKFKRSLK